MKYLKMLALAAMACTALMAFASAASATTLKAGGVILPAGTTISSSLKSGTSAILEETGGFLRNTCTGSTVKGKTENETGTTVTGNIEELTFSNCNFTTDVLANGKLHVSFISKTINGTVSSSGAKVTTNIGIGVCIYGTETITTIGTLDGTTDTTKHATMTINGVIPLIEAESGTCPSDMRWTGEYTVTSPTGLNVAS